MPFTLSHWESETIYCSENLLVSTWKILQGLILVHEYFLSKADIQKLRKPGSVILCSWGNSF